MIESRSNEYENIPLKDIQRHLVFLREYDGRLSYQHTGEKIPEINKTFNNILRALQPEHQHRITSQISELEIEMDNFEIRHPSITILRGGEIAKRTLQVLEDSGLVESFEINGVNEARKGMRSDANNSLEALLKFEAFAKKISEDESKKDAANQLLLNTDGIKSELARLGFVSPASKEVDFDYEKYDQYQDTYPLWMLEGMINPAIWRYGLIGFNTLKDLIHSFSENRRLLRANGGWQ